MKIFCKTLFVLAASFVCLTLFVSPVLAVKIGFVNNNIWLSKESPLAGEQVKIFTVIDNSSANAISGIIRFYDNNVMVGEPQAFSAQAEGVSKLYAVWTATEGNHQFTAAISSVVSIDANGVRTAVAGDATSQTETIYIDADSDADGITNRQENQNSTNPYNADSDNDGESDNLDPAPTNGQLTSGPDTDNDGISDKVDSDRDNDGLSNEDEVRLGTDQLSVDTDRDGVGDKEDYYPLDSKRSEKEIVAEARPSDSGTAETGLAGVTVLKKKPTAAPDEIISVSDKDVSTDGRVLGEHIFADEQQNEPGGSSVDEAAADSEIETSGNAVQSQGRLNFLASGKAINLVKILAAVTLLASLIFYRLSKKSASSKRSEADLEME